MPITESHLRQRIKNDFNADVAISRGCLAAIEAQLHLTVSSDLVPRYLSRAFIHARKAEIATGHADQQLIERLERLLPKLLNIHGERIFPSIDVRGRICGTELFFKTEGWATVYGLTACLSQKLSADPLLSVRYDLLRLSLCPIYWPAAGTVRGLSHSEKLDTIVLIARNIASPAVWSTYLADLNRSFSWTIYAETILPPNERAGPQKDLDIESLSIVLEFEPDPHVLAEKLDRKFWKLVVFAFLSSDKLLSSLRGQEYFLTVISLFAPREPINFADPHDIEQIRCGENQEPVKESPLDTEYFDHKFGGEKCNARPSGQTSKRHSLTWIWKRIFK